MISNPVIQPLQVDYLLSHKVLGYLQRCKNPKTIVDIQKRFGLLSTDKLFNALTHLVNTQNVCVKQIASINYYFY